MRSPVIAFSIFAAATVGPSVVSGAPAPKPPGAAAAAPGAGLVTGLLPGSGGNFGSGVPLPRAFQDPTDAPTRPSPDGLEGYQAKDKSHEKSKHHRRALDSQTGGGNAYTGNTSDTSGGTIVNEGDNDETLTNDTASESRFFIIIVSKLTNVSDAAGEAGASESGDAEGGDGRGRAPGGNAYTGSTGRASGGNVINESGSIDNTAASSKWARFSTISAI